jgi:predicted 3-demethylubiquinone-9 3-methyltransferase (glyoxalase superfamily)
MPADTPSGPEGSVKIVEFTLFGQPFMAMEAGEMDNFNHSVSFTVLCEDQAEIDKYYDALLKDGGKEENCGWVADKFGLRWQIVPKELNEMTASKDRDRARKAIEAMLGMKRLDLAKLRAAFGHAEEHRANT